MGIRNRLREEVIDAVSKQLRWAARNDRGGLVIMALQVVYAVWFAALWVKDFPAEATLVWGACFALSAVGAVAIERRR